MDTKQMKSKADFKVGQQVTVSSGRKTIQGTIVKLNPVRAVIRTEDGHQYTAPYAIVFAVGESTPPAVTVTSHIYAYPGQVIKTRDGQHYYITKRNKTRYTAVNLSTNKSYYIPFGNVTETLNGDTYLLEHLKEQGVPARKCQGIIDLMKAMAM